MTAKRKSRFQTAARGPGYLPNILSQSRIMMFVTVLGGLGLGGCSWISGFPHDKLPDRSQLILSGRADIEAVHNTMGNPLLASRYWGVELFRDAGSQTEIPIAFVIPFAKIKDDIYRYTLVSYDNHYCAESVATGILRKPSAWRSVSPIKHNYLTVHLQTPDFTFACGWEDRHETLLAAPPRRDAYLERARFSSQCTAVIGCGTRGCSNNLSIDGGQSLPLPCRLRLTNLDPNALTLLREGNKEEYEKRYPTVQYDTVAAISLAPGNHTLKAWGGRWQSGTLGGLFSGEKSISFSCRQGEIVYIIIDVFAKEYIWWGAKDIQWEIEVHKDMPEIFADRHLVLYRGDQWFVDPEPGN